MSPRFSLFPPRDMYHSWEYCYFRSICGMDRTSASFQLPAPKIYLVYCPWIEDIADIQLMGADTTLDFSPKAEEKYQNQIFFHCCSHWHQGFHCCLISLSPLIPFPPPIPSPFSFSFFSSLPFVTSNSLF